MTPRELARRHDHARGLELAARAVDFALTRAEITELQTHVAGCPRCAERAAGMRADALALGRPLTLLPSPRVDAAVLAEIARGHRWPGRLVLVAAAALLLLALLGTAAVGAHLLRSWQTLPITVVPPVSDPVAVSSPRPEASPTSTAAPSPSGPADFAVDPVVLLRVNIVSDVGFDRFPSLTLYRDGTLIKRGGVMTRLTPAGVGLLTAPAIVSNLFVTSGEINPDPSYVGGVPQWSIELRRDDAIVHRSTTHSGAVSPSQRTEANRIIALAEQLDDHESWLPATAWATAPASATRYIATQYLLMMAFEDGPGRRDLALDVADVNWPLAGRLEAFGTAEQEAVKGWAWRCGLVTQAEALAVQRALARASLRVEGENAEFDLDWVAAGKHLTVSLIPLLPDDPPDCTVVGFTR